MPTSCDPPTDLLPNKSRPLWRNRDYLLLWSGQAISAIGGSVSELAFPLLVLAVSHSPVQAGIAGALRTLPALLFTLTAGALIDRWDRKLVMICCDTGRALSLASIPVAIMLGHLTIVQLYITAFIEGSLLIFFGLAHSASLGQVVPREQLSSAMAQEEFTEGTTALFGPSLSGALFSLSRLLPFIADAFSYAVSIITLLLIRTPFQQQNTRIRRHLLAEISEGMRWMWRQPVMRTMNLASLIGALIIPGSSLMVIVLAQQQHASAFVIGLIFAAGGAGAILGAVTTAFSQRFLTVGQAIIVTRWTFALFWPLYALIPFPLVLGAIDFCIGFMDPIEDVSYFSYRLALIPDELRGRVISACRIFPSVVRPIGIALTGFMLQNLGAMQTALIGWGGLTIVALIFTLDPHVRRARNAQPPP
ncbi:MAG TPA: MFS transporter [Ktedonosporobacter sp.]|jgi:MFS family permease|nr:MFS transporter [Ktedonosporobacter sp.]